MVRIDIEEYYYLWDIYGGIRTEKWNLRTHVLSWVQYNKIEYFIDAEFGINFKHEKDAILFKMRFL